MLIRTYAILLFLFSAVPLFASTHTWIGTNSDKMSDPLNWSGGAPAGDDEATLYFPSGANTFFVTNDIAGLRVKELRFQSAYVLAGLPMITKDGSISGDRATLACPLQIEGEVLVYAFDFNMAGPISGTGGILFADGTVTMTGSESNTYSGLTRVRTARLQLKKTHGAIAIAGDVVGEPWSYPSRLIIQAPEQIADTATVRWLKHAGDIQMIADETIGTLDVDTGTTLFGEADPVPTLTVKTLAVSGYVTLYSNIRLQQTVLEVSREMGISFGKVIPPPEGITIRGEGSVNWIGDYAGPTRVEGATAYLRIPNSAVTMTGGTFAGQAKSIVATGGTLLNDTESKSDVRLGSAVLLSISSLMSPLRLNGALELGGAALHSRMSSEHHGIIIENASTIPVSGTFAGAPEGGEADHRFRVSYRGGDGNDVTLTDLRKPSASIAVTQITKPAYVGEPATFEIAVNGANGTPTGTISATTGRSFEVPATGQLSGGRATVQRTWEDVNNKGLYIDYSGDATYTTINSHVFSADVVYRAPVLSSIEPSSIPAGQIVEVTLRGSNFRPEIGVFGPQSELVFVSSSELRVKFDVRFYERTTTLPITVGYVRASVYSEPRDLIVTVNEPPSILSFDNKGAIASVVSGAKTAWMTTLSQSQPTYFDRDTDNDGIVRWDWFYNTQPPALWAVVDLTSGDFAVRGSGQGVANVLPYPAHTFVRDANGNVTRFVLKIPGDFTPRDWRLLWARPGVGAWTTTIRDGSDDDVLHNQILVGTATKMIPYGDSPAAPSAFAEGDVVIFLPRSSNSAVRTAFASRLDDELEGESAGVLQAASLFGWTVAEGATVRLPVLRTDGAAGTVSVRYSTVERSALHGVHLQPASGTLTFGPGEIVRFIEIPVIDDAIYRGDSLFNVMLSDPSGASLGDETVFVVSIDENDPFPQIRVEGSELRQIFETDGPQSVIIGLALNNPAHIPLTVAWYSYELNQFGSVVFAPGEMRKSITVVVPGNDTPNHEQRFPIRFSSGLVRPDLVYIALIDDESPRITVSDVRVGEGAGSAQVTLSLSQPSTWYMSVLYSTTNASAVSGSDYQQKSGVAEFKPGESQVTISIPIIDDAAPEGDEPFTVTLDTRSEFMALERKVIHVIIADDDAPTQTTSVSIDDATVAEASDGVAAASLRVRIPAAAARPVIVHYLTISGSAIGGSDYEVIEGSVTIAPGETQATIAIPVFDDAFDEEEETFFVKLISAANATIADDLATVKILDDDGPGKARPVRH